MYPPTLSWAKMFSDTNTLLRIKAQYFFEVGLTAKRASLSLFSCLN